MPGYDEILQQVVELIKPLAPPERQVEADTDLVADLEFDSLKVMNLIEQVAAWSLPKPLDRAALATRLMRLAIAERRTECVWRGCCWSSPVCLPGPHRRRRYMKSYSASLMLLSGCWQSSQSALPGEALKI